ncbi:MAG: hypothetical protein JO212_15985 [Acetobacteraceae bacterium]|nr:hypothetical protein [Acetobacteraceae bacterium]
MRRRTPAGARLLSPVLLRVVLESAAAFGPPRFLAGFARVDDAPPLGVGLRLRVPRLRPAGNNNAR